jgi:hypothetical protein
MNSTPSSSTRAMMSLWSVLGVLAVVAICGLSPCLLPLSERPGWAGK